MDNAEWVRLSSQLRSVVLTDRRLPEPVFQPGYEDFHFMEFDTTIVGKFWLTLQRLMRRSGDEHCSLVVLDPHPVKHFFSDFGSYGALRLDIGNTTNDYYDALSAEPDGSPADALLYNSEAIVWVPDSLDWAIWGERSLGVAIVVRFWLRLA